MSPQLKLSNRKMGKSYWAQLWKFCCKCLHHYCWRSSAELSGFNLMDDKGAQSLFPSEKKWKIGVDARVCAHTKDGVYKVLIMVWYHVNLELILLVFVYRKSSIIVSWMHQMDFHSSFILVNCLLDDNKCLSSLI